MSAKDIFLSRARLLLGAVLALALLAPAGVALAGLSGIGHRWIDILAQFTGQALAAAVLGLVAAGLLRFRPLIAGAGVVLALVVAAGWPQWFPTRGTPAEGSPTLTLYFANLYAPNADIGAMTRSIAAADADVVVLVEVGAAPREALDTILAGYPHRQVRGPADAASLIASRRPMRDLKLAIPGLHASAARVETPLGPVTMTAVHMTRPWPYQVQWEQIRQAEGLAAWARAADGPFVAAGDFNSVSSARIGKIVKAADLIPEPGWPGTWPTRLPAAAGTTIDHVYRSPDLALVDRRLGLATGSDHRPVIVRLKRAAPPAE